MLTYAVDSAPLCLDPHVSTQDLTAEIQRNVLDSLVAEDASGRFHPWLATSWSSAKDLKSYTFHLREDVTFSDGTPFDAEAVKANFDHITDKNTKSQYAVTLLGPYQGTEVLGRYQVRVTFTRPFVPFLQAASTSYLGMYSPAALKANADKLCGGGAVTVGSGPFIETNHVKGQSIEFTRNPRYQWPSELAKHRGPAYLDRLVIRILRENSTRVGALTSRQVDLARAVPPARVGTIEAGGAVKILRGDFPGGVYSLYLNTTNGPLTDERVRVAVQRGINIDQAVRTVYFGQYKRAWSPLSPSTPAYAGDLTGSWPYDPAKAGALLDQAGWTGRDAAGYRTKDGRRLTLEWPALPSGDARENREVLAQAIQADLKKLGVEVVRPSYDVGAYSTKVNAGQFGILDLSWARFEPDLLRSFFNSANGPPAGQNASFLKDPEVDKWTETAAATNDTATRTELYARTQHKVIKVGATVPVYVPTALTGVASSVHGVSLDPNNWLMFYDAWRDGA
ncbi:MULTISPECIES: ABC transporter substrate-binding protein [unclassified Nonomuraea]|uniref:ABC transporter substrate-binding protein n=1 Tax=unclassified Nonomuraea TaxID=2593643 RepID=UPI0033E29565